MMTAEKAVEDGNLPAARRNLSNAISRLIDPKPHTHDGQIRWAEPLYVQLVDAIPGTQGTRSAVPQSSPPLNLNAAELKAEIDTAVAIWEPNPIIDRDEHMTIIRLQAFEERRWRPQDVTDIEAIVSKLLGWCEKIVGELDPKPNRTLPNPCPQCKTAIVHRRNSAGEVVRQPALKIDTDKCVCQSCRAEWDKGTYPFLARVLGYDKPEGVIDDDTP